MTENMFGKVLEKARNSRIKYHGGASYGEKK